MELCNEKYKVTSKVESVPLSRKFDTLYNTEHIHTDDFCMARTFSIERSDGFTRYIGLLDSLCGGCEPYAVLEENILTVILFCAIVQIDLDTGTIVQYSQCDNMGGLLEIHRIENGYLIRGENDIFRYDRFLRRVWHFSGRDILVSLEKDKSFWLEDGLIHCRDFLGWHYVLDFDGNLLYEFRESDNTETP